MTHQWMSRIPLVSWLTLAWLVLALACGPDATPVPEPTSTPAPPPPATESPALAEAEEPVPAPVSVPVQQNAPPPVPMEVPTPTLAPTPTPMPSPTATAVPTPTPTPEPIPTRTQTPTAIPTILPTALPRPTATTAAIQQVITVQDTDEEATPEPTPTPEQRCLEGAPGEIYCYTPPTPTATPVYPELSKFSKYAVAAEEATDRGVSKSDKDYPRVFVAILVRDVDAGKQMKTWLYGSGIQERYYEQSELAAALEGRNLGIYFSTGIKIHAMVTADLLRQVAQRPGYSRMTDGCISFDTYVEGFIESCPNED